MIQRLRTFCLLTLVCVTACATGASQQEAQSREAECPRYVGNTRICCGAEDEVPGVNCVPEVDKGGIYDACIGQGELIEGKVLGAQCCQDLERIEYAELDERDTCVSLGPPSLQICAACGNDQCESGENRCNCPADCG